MKTHLDNLLPFLAGILLLTSVELRAQHTFSIVAVDSVTGEIGSAGATCGDSIVWPGTPGALIISDIIPGIGAIHTQAYYQPANQMAARNRMLAGDSPADIIQYMITHDVQLNPHIRQYGVVDYNNGHPRSAAYTGINCNDYKNHITGPGYAIQGNILLGQQVLDSMESRFLTTQGTLADKLMAAMQGAKMVGADTRCIPDSTSSLSAFLRVGRPGDHPDSLYLHLNVAGTPQWVDPIDVLQARYDNWLIWLGLKDETGAGELRLYPNPARDILCLDWAGTGEAYGRIIVADIAGHILRDVPFSGRQRADIHLSGMADGIYLVKLVLRNGHSLASRFTLSRGDE